MLILSLTDPSNTVINFNSNAEAKAPFLPEGQNVLFKILGDLARSSFVPMSCVFKSFLIYDSPIN